MIKGRRKVSRVAGRKEGKRERNKEKRTWREKNEGGERKMKRMIIDGGRKERDRNDVKQIRTRIRKGGNEREG